MIFLVIIAVFIIYLLWDYFRPTFDIVEVEDKWIIWIMYNHIDDESIIRRKCKLITL